MADTRRVELFLMHYGDFLAFWSTFDMMVEVLIMRELGTDIEKTSIVCAGLNFGAKVAIACSLMNTRPGTDVERTVALIKEAQRIAERNSFAHGFFLINRDTEAFQLIRREVKDKYSVRSREMDSDTMGQHCAAFTTKVAELQKHASISDRDLADYGKEIEALALAQAELDKRRPGSQTNFSKANKKVRDRRPQ